MNNSAILPKKSYNVGEIFEFKVKRLYPTYCELTDEASNITTYLQGTARLKLFKGQTVKCRITAVSEKHPKVELVDISQFEQSKVDITEKKLSNFLAQRHITWNTKDFVKLLLTEEKDHSFESQCHRWIQHLLNKKISLRLVRKDCSSLLELSDLLSMCDDMERDFYQERLTLLIEQIGYYIKATDLIDNEAKESEEGTPAEFIDNLFRKLKVSGFVYHPTKNFNILSSLFLCRPDLMHSRMNELLDIIRQRDMKAWEKEPFRSALIKLLELYIRECDGKIDKTKDNKEMINTNLKVLALQLLLLGGDSDTSIADHKLNTARLCTISSYLYTLNPKQMVDMAYYCLFHSEPKRISYGVPNISLIPHYIASMYPGSGIDTVNSFTHNNAKLLISADGIQLRPSRAERSMHPVFPKELGLWKGMQVYLNAKPETSLASVKPNDITPYQNVWNEIEAEFFNMRTKAVVAAPVKKRRHRVGDIVQITFTKQDKADVNKYYCQIEDEDKSEGFINVDDIVPYKMTTYLRHFFTSDGSPLIFEAQIVDIEEDKFHFSMKQIIKDCLTEYYSDDEDIVCSVGSAPNAYGAAPAISREGVSVTIRNAREFEGIGKGSIVSCRLIGRASGPFHIECDISGPSASDYDLSSAFKTLMEDMAVGRMSEDIGEQGDDQMLETDKVLDESYVREVIYLIDRMGIIDKEYVKAYNYLAFARILCMLIGWESQAAYYKGRMDIIAMLHYFAQNAKVDEERLSQLENANADLFSSNTLMRERFMQLQTISYMGKPGRNDDLYRLSANDQGLKELALLVLAYNIALDSNMDKTANDIHNRIKQQLNLKGFETGLKQYGSGAEGVAEEYKSSIVFCADKDLKGMNQERQMAEILKVINSFLNTFGGTLYIGVNDSGMGIGVENDLRTSLYYGDKDKYLRTITDAVSLKWGNAVAATYIEHIGFDADNENEDVVIVKIRPHAQGLPLDGWWYVRVGSSKRALDKTDFDTFQKISRNLQPSAVQEIAEVAASVLPTEQAAPQPAPLVTSREDTIGTSRIRKNIIHDYEDNYVEPIALFKFMGNNKFKVLASYDYDNESLLTLTVLDNEEKSYLVLGYDNGHIVKIAVKELLDYQQDKEHFRHSGAKLLFASIAGEDDAVLTIAKDGKTKPQIVMRADSLAHFEPERLQDSGTLPYNEGLISQTLAYEVIPAKHKQDFSGILDKKKTFAGYPANQVTRGMVSMLHMWGVTEI